MFLSEFLHSPIPVPNVVVQIKSPVLLKITCIFALASDISASQSGKYRVCQRKRKVIVCQIRNLLNFAKF